MAAWRASLAVADGQKQLTREARMKKGGLSSSWYMSHMIDSPLPLSRRRSHEGTRLSRTRKIRNCSSCKLLMALAFSAAPLTLYLPPVRSLSLFVEAIEAVFRDCAPYSQGAIFRFRLGLSRILSGLARALR
ncbi:hypothetical protein OsI_10222 [Oryza sativa Indica Group]|uniref:Uncharacterized protein n=1 Tax=Oryza sativa subsp. indica TaxID=39946 RepID=A2XD38_ORYSI|nr:hypothetical protein OsI_10222 [Oryza sativa Indica Group]